MKKIFIATPHQALLANEKLASFDALWSREIAWFEEPNQRRGGWRGVGRLALGQTASVGVN